jgi:hypothetical protein
VASDQRESGAVSTRDDNQHAPDLAAFIAAVSGSTGTPLVVRSFASQITILDGAVITIQRVHQHLSPNQLSANGH